MKEQVEIQDRDYKSVFCIYVCITSQGGRKFQESKANTIECNKIRGDNN